MGYIARDEFNDIVGFFKDMPEEVEAFNGGKHYWRSDSPLLTALYHSDFTKFFPDFILKIRECVKFTHIELLKGKGITLWEMGHMSYIAIEGEDKVGYCSKRFREYVSISLFTKLKLWCGLKINLRGFKIDNRLLKRTEES